ncbi:MAG: hypothetical protein BMS9Abin34_146 [Patescibacteria group bacterium]|nr:MAG: hypothetical protein BMS9Abin34_146 [Patescibacteria group bacterium]
MKDLLRKLKGLDLPKGEFAIFGGSVMEVHGLRKAHDLDIIVTRSLWRKLVERFPVGKFSDGSPGIFLENIEIMRGPGFGFDPEELVRSAEIINEIRFVRLEDLKEWKRRMGRKKDLKDIKLIEDYLEKNSRL